MYKTTFMKPQTNNWNSYKAPMYIECSHFRMKRFEVE